MNNTLKIISTLKNLTLTLNSWETLPVFDVVMEITDSIFKYTVDGFLITLRERGTYKIEMALNIATDIETSVGISLRLNVNGVDQPIDVKGYSENTLVFFDDITINDVTEIVIQVYASTDDTPTLSIADDCLLLIRKVL